MGFLEKILGRAWRFVRDLCLDSHAAVSFAAPVTTLGFTLAKWAEVPIVGLKDVSYAWALLPLLIWFMAGYTRRRAMTDRTTKIRKLKEFYASADSVARAKPDNFPEYMATVDAWLNNCATWIRGNMGPLAEARFLDRSGMMAVSVHGAINEQHNAILSNISRFKENLKQMIETSVWDHD